ncbi:biotin synthase BioB [Hippea sp. KM1]|uniref:biotin synthase BioB n=1 Tax=Hippea sp. KM1 TaxID=944481 RepID=UPI00046D0C65|nr:biotin synthase BioB [Hippea sp. KM1]
MLNNLVNKAIKKAPLSRSEIDFLISCPIDELCKAALKIKENFFGNKIEFCSIINAKSGLCPEDCKFCAQSAHYKTNIKEYPFIDIKGIEQQAKKLKSNGVKRLSIVISGKSPTKSDLLKIESSLKIIEKSGLIGDASVGILNKDDLLRLKKASLNGFHRNLEVSEGFFRNICTTHKYKEDIETVKTAMQLGFYVCSGGIFGVGEGWKDRIELALTLKKLKVHSIPLNFLTPIKGTPLENMPILKEEEALRIIAVYRFLLADKQIRVCGGRNTVFSPKTKRRVLLCGASGLMVGNYLTTKGFDITSDLKDLKELNMQLLQ